MKAFPRTYGKHVLRSVYHIDEIERARKERLLRIRSNNKANVLFVASSLSMWRLDDVYKLMRADCRFYVHVVICPFSTFELDQKKKSIEDLCKHAADQGWSYSIKDNLNDSDNLIHSFDPDIIFYPQLFGRLFGNELDCEKNLDRLIAYVPYGLPTVSGEWMYNSRYMNTVWKLFFPTELHLKHARKHSFNRAKNMIIVGDAHASDFLEHSHSYHWKEQDTKKKKVIWAPHYSIGKEGFNIHRASFLWLSDIMWKISQDYQDRIQFVFKPHPRLLSELYRHPDWGKEKADAYYDKWTNGNNTQIETGSYIDLFCTSDAMIHDCGSFTAEYHYTGKPVAFVSKDFGSIYQELDKFGTMCLDQHYHIHSEMGIRDFLDKVVLGGDDHLKKDREAFRNKYLIPEEGSSFAASVYKNLVHSVFEGQ